MTTEASPVNTTGEQQPVLSKNAQKRLAKELKFKESRETWKANQKILRKERKAKRRITQQNSEEAPTMVKKVRKITNPFSLVKVAIDLSFDDLMIKKEIQSLTQQLVRCHHSNKYVTNPIKIHLNFPEHSLVRERLKIAFPPYQSYQDFRIQDDVGFEQLVESEGKENVVYLSSEASDNLNELQEGILYVIGGLVDKNRHKGLTFKKAQDLGLRTAKLPIDDYLKLEGRKVLAVNHVFEILLQYLETKDWNLAFRKVIPSRRLPSNKESSDESSEVTKP